MSNSSPPPASVLTNETSTGSSASPPQSPDGTPPPPASQAPPPVVSLPSPPDSASDTTQNESPPPSLSPPAPPPVNSVSPPPPPVNSVSPPPPPSSSISPPPPPKLNSPPSLSAPPPLQALNHSASPLPVAPGQPASPSNNPPPTSQNSLPSTPPPVTSSPLPETPLVSPPPPITGAPSLTLPSQPSSPEPEQPVNFPVSPTLPETSPSTSIPSPSSPITEAKPTPSTTPDSRLPNSASQVGPPSAHTRSSSSNHTPTTSSDGLGSGTFVGITVTVVGVVLVLVAIIFVTSRKKRRRMDGLVNNYRPPPAFSVKSDGHYGQVNQVGHSNRSDTYYAGDTTGSCRGYISESAGIGSSKSSFTYQEIADMTHEFSQQNLLGEGGFGCVYKGWMLDGRVVAVKQLKSGSGQGEREFRAEVEIISRVHHRHLVSLVGYCIADNQRSLVYEFVPNNTLEHHLHGKGLPVLDWPKRLKIAIGSSRGLAYLHEDCHPRIIHRDIKSANILLDNSFEAQVADFGLAKLSNDTYTHVSTRVMGTFGYMAPEYASSGKLTDRSDVFSFGVVLLELITGRKPVDPSQPLGDESLVEWARPHLVHSLETRDFEELADPRLENNYVNSEMFRMIEVAAACVRHSAPKRPRMVQVLRALDNEGELADLSNGVKFGQSTVFESGQYSADIQQFRKMAFGGLDSSSEYGSSGEYNRGSSRYSSEHSSGDAPHRPLNP